MMVWESEDANVCWLSAFLIQDQHLFNLFKKAACHREVNVSVNMSKTVLNRNVNEQQGRI